MKSTKVLFGLSLGLAAALVASGQTTQINGAGATFPYPIYSKWFSEYNKMHPDIEINYQSIGSGGGIKQLTAQTVFFGASDGPMSEDQMKGAPGPILHFPTVLGGVVPIYNVPGVTGELKFTGAVLADLILGKIKKWNDPAIARLNPGVKLPDTDVTVVHRSDGSGTTYIFVDYLSQDVAGVQEDDRRRVHVRQLARRHRRQGQRGRRRPGQADSGRDRLRRADLRDSRTRSPTGPSRTRPVSSSRASLASVTAAAASAAKSMPGDFRVSITNAPGKGAYPISSFTWLLFYEKPADKARAKIMVDFTKWALTDGQKYCAELGYAPLPAEVVALEMNALKRIAL